MGNSLIAQIPSVDALIHVVRAFEDEEVQHCDGEVDPLRDLEVVQNQLIEKDKSMVARHVEDVNKILKRTPLDKDAKEDKAVLEKVVEVLKENKNVKNAEWTNREVEILNKFLYLTSKPVIYLINLSENDYAKKKNKWLAKIMAWISTHGGGKVVPYSVSFESKLNGLDEEEKLKITKEVGAESNLGKITAAVYSSLDLIHYFSSGPEEVKCWTIRKDTKAPQSASAIHPNYEKRFISADIMKYDDLVKLGSEVEVKKAGLIKNEGKSYDIVDGDIIDFKLAAITADTKKK